MERRSLQFAAICDPITPFGAAVPFFGPITHDLSVIFDLDAGIDPVFWPNRHGLLTSEGFTLSAELFEAAGRSHYLCG